MDIDGSGKPIARYAALWVEPVVDDDARLYVGAKVEDEPKKRDELRELGLDPRTLQVLHLPDGSPRVSGVWGRPASRRVARRRAGRDLFERDFVAIRAKRGDEVILDASVGGASVPRTVGERARIALERARKTLEDEPDNLDARRSRAIAELRLGERAKALEGLLTLVDTKDDDAEILPYHAVGQARLGRKSEAAESLARFRRRSTRRTTSSGPSRRPWPRSWDLAARPLIQAIEASLAKAPEDAGLRYEAARAFAAASKADRRARQGEGARSPTAALRTA